MATAATIAPKVDNAHDISFETTARWTEGLRTDVTARQFEIGVDEPADLGGADTAPNPMELLLAGLNGCLAVVAKTVAKEQGANIHAITFATKATLDPRGFLGTAEVQPYFKTAHVTIHLGSDIPEGRFDAFTRAVESRCPAGTLFAAANGVDFRVDWVRA